MKIEDAIQQRKFSSEHEKVIINILYTSAWLSQQHAADLRPFRLSPEQYNVLRILRGVHPEPLRLTDISERMIEKSSNVTRLVEKLRRKGFLRRELCIHNRRQVDINITPKALEILRMLDDVSKDWTARIKSLKVSEAKLLNELLDKTRALSE